MTNAAKVLEFLATMFSNQRLVDSAIIDLVDEIAFGILCLDDPVTFVHVSKIEQYASRCVYGLRLIAYGIIVLLIG